MAMDEKIFSELLFADVVRGRHATGVATVKGQCRDVSVHKRALPSPLYLELGSAQDHLARFTSNTVVLGHNRHATKGNSGDPEGAHPFQHGNITLVHNGSLTTHYALTTENFTVDSEAICKAISVDGIEIVAPKLRGAFALVWIDSDNNTLNFLRNGEREFAIAWNETANRMWWASEKRMLEWSLNRDTFTRTPVVYNECFELPVGKWISIPITHSSIDISERTETELDVSDSVFVSTYNNYNTTKNKSNQTSNVTNVTSTILEKQATGGPLSNERVTEYRFGDTRETALKKITSALVDERGRVNYLVRSFVSAIDVNTDALILDDRIGMFLTSWEPYEATTSKLGVAFGQTMEYPYTETLIHGITESEYDGLYKNTSGMITGYLTGFKLPPSSDISIKAGTILQQEDLVKFSLVIRKDSLRKADLDDFYWDMDNMPAEDTNVDTKELSTKEPNDPLLVFQLPDGTTVSPGGTAIFKGVSSTLEPDLRYKITRIERQETNNTVLLSASFGQDSFIYSADKWESGTLSKQADTEEGSKEVMGPNGELISVGKWEVAVSKGCCHCKEVPKDPEDSEGLKWVGDRFFCEPCVFDLANVGYS